MVKLLRFGFSADLCPQCIVYEPIPGPNVENHHCTHTVPIIFIPFLFYMLHVALLYNFLKEIVENVNFFGGP